MRPAPFGRFQCAIGRQSDPLVDPRLAGGGPALLDDPELRHRRAAAARERVEHLYDVEKAAAAYVSQYRFVKGARPK
jgi:hypothetical protein